MYDATDALSLSSEEILMLSRKMTQVLKINLNSFSKAKEWYPIYSLGGDEYLDQVCIDICISMLVYFYKHYRFGYNIMYINTYA